MITTVEIQRNITEINRRIAVAAHKSGRAPSDITLLAATKTMPPELISQAIAYGITDIGENRAQELIDKFPHIHGAAWHFIGRLQTNKVKYIIDKVSLIHSVDNLGQAQEISRLAARAGKVQDILIQVNIAQEQSKGGVLPAEYDEFVCESINLANIRLRGIMSIPPKHISPRELTNLYERCKKVLIDTRQKMLDNRANIINAKYFDKLSLGMSADYETAIKCGANIVRIGSGIFGERVY
jgi:pyridoxal phosphate enzyme (YggS family)